MDNPVWTIDTLAYHVAVTQRAADERYNQRFIAQQEALTTARNEATRAFTEAEAHNTQRYDSLRSANEAVALSAEKAVSAALASADRAVQKAEASSERRFESVNEFRNTLADQAATLLPRAEGEARIRALSEKIDDASARVASLVTRGEHEVLATVIRSLELSVKDAVRREDLKPISDAIDKLRDANAGAAGKSTAFSQIVTVGLAALAIVVSLGLAIYSSHVSAPPPTLTITPDPTVTRLDNLNQRLDRIETWERDHTGPGK